MIDMVQQVIKWYCDYPTRQQVLSRDMHCHLKSLNEVIRVLNICQANISFKVLHFQYLRLFIEQQSNHKGTQDGLRIYCCQWETGDAV